MKIECDKCSAKYSIADEKVRGKTFKIRCKKCSNVIIVRDKGVVSDAGSAAAVESGGPGWHLAINGETVGPLGEDEVRQRFAAGEIDRDTAVWQEGFDDWLPLGEIDVFSDLPERGGGAAAPAEDPFAASANQDDYAVGAGRSVGVGAAAAVAATGTDGPSEPQSPRVSKLTGQRNENSVLFSLDSLQAMATSGAATAKPNVAAPAARASANPSKGLATSAPSSEGSGLIDIRSLGSMVGGGGAVAAASAAPQAAADDAALPSFGGGGFGGLAATPLISPTPAAAEAPPPVVVQQRSNAPLYIMMIVLILAVGGLGAYIVMKPPEEPKTIVQEVPVVAPSVKDDDDKDKDKDKDDEDKDKDKDEKKDDEKAAEGETEGGTGEAAEGGDEAKGGAAKKSGGSGGSKKSGGSGGSTSTGGSGGSTKTGGDSGSTKSGGGSDSAPSVDCILDPSKCGSSKKTGGGSSGGGTSGGSTDPSAPEKLSATDIKNGMAGVKDAAKACGPKHGAKPGEKVTVKLSFSGATGTVTKATPQPPHDGTPLGNCVAGALKNAKVIKFKTASQGASYSVTM